MQLSRSRKACDIVALQPRSEEAAWIRQAPTNIQKTIQIYEELVGYIK